MAGLATNAVLEVVARAAAAEPAVTAGAEGVPWASTADAASTATVLSPVTSAIRFTVHTFISPVSPTNLGTDRAPAGNRLPVLLPGDWSLPGTAAIRTSRRRPGTPPVYE